MNYTPNHHPTTAPEIEPRSGDLVLVSHEKRPDPYPEHLPWHPGVRQHTQLAAAADQTSTDPPAARRGRRLFGASLLLSIAAQGVLAAALATHLVEPIVGVVAAIALLFCGLVLIGAETLSRTNR